MEKEATKHHYLKEIFEYLDYLTVYVPAISVQTLDSVIFEALLKRKHTYVSIHYFFIAASCAPCHFLLPLFELTSYQGCLLVCEMVKFRLASEMKIKQISVMIFFAGRKHLMRSVVLCILKISGSFHVISSLNS